MSVVSIFSKKSFHGFSLSSSVWSCYVVRSCN